VTTAVLSPERGKQRKGSAGRSFLNKKGKPSKKRKNNKEEGKKEGKMRREGIYHQNVAAS